MATLSHWSPHGRSTSTSVREDGKRLTDLIQDVSQCNGSKILQARFRRLLVILRHIARLMLSDADGEYTSYRRIEKSSELFKQHVRCVHDYAKLLRAIGFNIKASYQGRECCIMEHEETDVLESFIQSTTAFLAHAYSGASEAGVRPFVHIEVRWFS